MPDAVLQRRRTLVLAARLPENATTWTSVGVEVRVGVAVGATAVFVGVFVGVAVGTTAVFVGVLVGVLVGGTAVFVGVFVGVAVGTSAVFVGVFVGVGVGVPCNGLKTAAPCRAGLAQLTEDAAAAKPELCSGFELLAVNDVPANDESAMPPTTAATSTVMPTTLPMAS